MNNSSKIQGPAAALFDEPQISVDDELFNPSVGSPDQMRLQILEARMNELYDFLIRVDARNINFLPVNRIHRGTKI